MRTTLVKNLMATSFPALPDLLHHGYDTVIDVRSPAEFAVDHVPGAINLPALTNDERAEVGTIYKQISPFKARKIGAALVLNNIAKHIAGPLKNFDGGWKPLVYCWRGGQRSGVFAMVLKEVGWRADTIQGGYQSFRRLVNTALYDQPLPHRIVLLDGDTGTAKTALLPLLSARGIQTLDLEGLARHRGSLLGAMPGGQPAQRGFETAIAAELAQLDPAKPTVIEAESSKIGRLNLPPSLWTAMLDAPRIALNIAMPARIAYLAEAYSDILRDPETVRTRLAGLRYIRGHAVVDRWQTLQDAKNYTGLAAALMADHYDPSYAKSRQSDTRQTLAEITSDTLDKNGLNLLADQIAARLTSL